ncbi:MAG: ABC transporter permease subunit [Dehalococcoidia bacterium]
MSQYVIRRLLLLFPTVVIVTVLVFTIIRLLPADTVDIIYASGRSGGTGGSPQGKELMRERLGLRKNPVRQYITWLIGWPEQISTGLKSRDEGLTWSNLKPVENSWAESFVFVDETRGWGLGKGRYLWRITSRGANWTFIDFVSKQHELEALSFIDKNTGWVVGSDGAIFYTDDPIRRIAGELNEGDRVREIVKKAKEAGAPYPIDEIAQMIEGGRTLDLSAEEIKSIINQLPRNKDGQAEPWIFQSSGTTQRLVDVAFVDAQNGWILTEKSEILHTENGGITWTPQPLNIEKKLSTFTFIDPDSGWAVGEDGLVLHTADGGATWVPQESHITASLNDILFLDASNGWAVGDEGYILRTGNGGLTWFSQSTTVKKDLLSIDFTDLEKGLAVGEGGTILRTTDGGFNWVKLESVTSKPLQEVVFVGKIGYTLGKSTQWQWGALGGNLGRAITISPGIEITELLKKAAPISLQLGLMAILMAALAGIPIGVVSAVRQDTIGDYAGRTVALMGLAVPSFWIGSMILLLPAIYFQWTPPREAVDFVDNPISNLAFLAIPAAVAALPRMASIMRMTRGMTLEVVRQDYVRTAWAKGLTERAVILRHVIKNALIPVVSIMGLEFVSISGELVIVENIFDVPGLGRLALNSVLQRDFPTLQGVALVLGIFVVFVNLVVDLFYGYLDPRVRQN